MGNPRDEYHALYESASDLLFSQEIGGRITRVNRAFERLTGLNRMNVVGTSVFDRIDAEQRDMYRQRILERIGGAPAQPFEVELLGAHGRVHVELSVELSFQDGVPVGLLASGRDIMEQVRSRMDRAASDVTLLRQTEELATFSLYLQLLHRLSTTTYSNLDELFSDYLSTGCEIFSLECGAIVELSADGPQTRKTAGHQCGDDLEELTDRVRNEEITLVGSLPGRSGTFGAASFFVGTPIFTGNDLFGVLLFWSEVSHETHPQAREMIEMMARGMESAIQQRRLTDELEYRARHDSLTALANRVTLSEQLTAEIDAARVMGTGVGVIFMDLDQFKEINDSLGHAAGDSALQEIARRFRSAAGARMLVARVGGDEFAAVVPNVRTGDEAEKAATQLLDSLAEPLDLKGEYRSVTASSGVAVFPRDGENGAALLVKADAAMYEGKQAGGNRVRVSSVRAGSPV